MNHLHPPLMAALAPMTAMTLSGVSESAGVLALGHSPTGSPVGMLRTGRRLSLTQHWDRAMDQRSGRGAASVIVGDVACPLGPLPAATQSAAAKAAAVPQTSQKTKDHLVGSNVAFHRGVRVTATQHHGKHGEGSGA